MFRLTSVVVALALLPACGGSGADTPEEAARIAFEGLRSGDLEDYEALLPTADDVGWSLETIGRERGVEALRAARRNIEEQGGMEKTLESMRQEIRDDFARARKRAARKLDWSTAEFVGIDEPRLRIRTDKGQESARIFFLVKSDRILHVFELPDCVKVDRGWFCVEGVRYRGPK